MLCQIGDFMYAAFQCLGVKAGTRCFRQNFRVVYNSDFFVLAEPFWHLIVGNDEDVVNPRHVLVDASETEF